MRTERNIVFNNTILFNMSNLAKHDSMSFVTYALFLGVCSAYSLVGLSARKQERRNQKITALKREAQEQYARCKGDDASEAFKKKLNVGRLMDSISIDEVYLWEVEHLTKRFESEAPKDHVNLMSKETHYNKLIGKEECVIVDIVQVPDKKSPSKAFLRAGPRKYLHFNPETVNAAIVTCGGLCPGLNNVIREITNSLVFTYGIKGKVWGIRGGYKGFYDPSFPPVELTPHLVENIHHTGGTILSSSRGGFDLDKIITFIQKMNIKQLYVIGGDGTHRGAYIIHEECMNRNLNVAVAGIPKTIDNDVDHIDRSFGFESAVEAAQDAIRCAKVEASCNLPNGIGIVKLMGRSAGFIAAHATLASGDVDLCLVPEVPTVLEGEIGCLPHLYKRVKSKGYAVIVVAEGAGEEILGTSTETDASGNKKLPAIGRFMKDAAEDYFKKMGETATVKYIDPSYMVRSVKANAADSFYCMQLGQNAVHGAMAGFTGFSVGLCKNKMVYLPIPNLVATSPRLMDKYGRTWERVLALTRQPNTCLKE